MTEYHDTSKRYRCRYRYQSSTFCHRLVTQLVRPDKRHLADSTPLSIPRGRRPPATRATAAQRRTRAIAGTTHTASDLHLLAARPLLAHTAGQLPTASWREGAVPRPHARAMSSRSPRRCRPSATCSRPRSLSARCSPAARPLLAHTAANSLVAQGHDADCAVERVAEAARTRDALSVPRPSATADRAPFLPAARPLLVEFLSYN